MTLPFKFSQRGFFYFIGALILLLVTVPIVGERGAVHLWRLRGEKSKIDEQNYRLQKENEALRQRVSRIHYDNYYLETLAREELNMVLPGEVVYRFPRIKPDNAQRNPLSESLSESRSSAGRKERR